MLVTYSSNNKIEEQILSEGIKLKCQITSCECKQDPRDNEHTIFEIKFEYHIDDQKIEQELSFSINTDHIAYASMGGLLNVPKLDISVDDFKKSLLPGNIFDITSLNKPPYDFIFYFNEKLSEVMNYRQMWM